MIDESITAYTAVSRYVRFERGRWFRLRGGGIGAGMPIPLGVQLADPDGTVVALVGDGSALYTITALWTAAHERLPVTWIILNNTSYRVLKENARRESPSTEAAERLVGVDLVDPEIDFVSLAGGFGVEAHRVTHPDKLREIVSAALDRRPSRPDRRVDQWRPDEEVTRHVFYEWSIDAHAGSSWSID